MSFVEMFASDEMSMMLMVLVMPMSESLHLHNNLYNIKDMNSNDIYNNIQNN